MFLTNTGSHRRPTTIFLLDSTPRRKNLSTRKANEEQLNKSSYLLPHSDDYVGIATTQISNRKVYTFVDMNSKKTQQGIRRHVCLKSVNQLISEINLGIRRFVRFFAREIGGRGRKPNHLHLHWFTRSSSSSSPDLHLHPIFIFIFTRSSSSSSPDFSQWRWLFNPSLIHPIFIFTDSRSSSLFRWVAALLRGRPRCSGGRSTGSPSLYWWLNRKPSHADDATDQECGFHSMNVEITRQPVGLLHDDEADDEGKHWYRRSGLKNENMGGSDWWSVLMTKKGHAYEKVGKRNENERERERNEKDLWKKAQNKKLIIVELFYLKFFYEKA